MVATAVMLGWSLAASAADQVVTNTADSGAGSLRQAIADATDGASITFAAGLDGSTITLTSGQSLLIHKSLRIDASARIYGGITVSGNHAVRVFEVVGLVEGVAGTATVEFIGLTIKGGQTAGNGGGILNFDGTLVLADTTLSGNSAALGGAVFSQGGTLTVNRCRVTDNTATGNGGGFGLFANDGAIHIIDTTVSGNTATAGGGGGLFARFNAGVTISRSTLSANSAAFGAGMYNGDGVLEVANSTIADNAATTGPGGGLHLENSTAMLDHVTVAGNQVPFHGGGGLYLANAELTLQHSIIAGNSAPQGADVWLLSGLITTVGANLIGNNDTVTAPFPAGPLVGNLAAPLDPGLAPLADHGGLTRTRPPLPGGPAVDAADSGPADDQRGIVRPRGVNFDLGAVERIPAHGGPVTLGLTRQGDGSLRVASVDYRGMTHAVLASANLALPLHLWSNLGPALEAPPGSSRFQFTDAQAASHPQRFYAIEASDTNMVTVQGGTQAMSMGTETVDTFRIGKTEVTWAEWQEVRTEAATRGYDIARGVACASDHPVHTVNWFDAVKWCNLRSEIEGLTPVYTRGGATYRSGEAEPVQNLSANGYRLPLDTEWEFASRGGVQAAPTTYSGSNVIGDVAWYADNSGGAACNLSNGQGTWPVGGKAPNQLGLHDMSGNVWEWGWEGNSSRRRLSGGSWAEDASNCRVASRVSLFPGNRVDFFGFRVARNAGN